MLLYLLLFQLFKWVKASPIFSKIILTLVIMVTVILGSALFAYYGIYFACAYSLAAILSFLFIRIRA